MICFICKKTLCNVNQLVAHLKSVHQLKSKDSYRCYYCSQLFKDVSTYKKHILRKHVDVNDKDISDKQKDAIKNISGTERSSVVSKEIFSFPSIYDDDEPFCCESQRSYDNDTKKNDGSSENSFNFSSQNLLKNSLKFLVALHAKHNFTRKNVFEIRDNVLKMFVKPILEIFQNFANIKIREQNAELFNEMKDLIINCEILFDYCKSEHLFNKELKANGYMEDIKECVINNEIDTTYQKGELVFDEKEAKMVLLPLRHQFQKTFEKNDLLTNMLLNMESLKKNKHFVNIIQGPLWNKKCELYPDKILVPYFIYSDDLEINNPLASHSTIHSICNFYYSFPCLPEGGTKLNNIFLAAVIKSQDMKKFGNETCLKHLINEMIFLEKEGIDITSSNGMVNHVYFVVALILGDNLALNSILNFNKSFSGKFCRFCRIDKNSSRKACSEVSHFMRNYKNYEEDIKKQNSKETGIVNECIFNRIPSFHVVENLSVDVMHDILEGICHYDLCHIILYFVQNTNYLNLKILNQRKQTFEYGAIEIGNFSPEITLQHLNKRHLKMSASEMLSFVLYLPLMIGDLIPSDDEVWMFLLLLIETIELILSYEVTDNLISTLKMKIEVHNKQFITLFNDTLKPKFHILTHYPTILQNCGPVKKFWSFKYEAKHRHFKLYSHSVTSRKNICLTLAKKFQLYFADYLLNNAEKAIKHYLSENTEMKSNLIKLISVKLNKKEKDLKLYTQIEYNGIIYKRGYQVGKCSDDIKIYNIISIVVFEKNILLFCQHLRKTLFCPHFVAYEIDPSVLGEYYFLKFEELIGPPANITKTARGKNLIRFKEYSFVL